MGLLTQDDIRARVEGIQKRIATAAARAGRNVGEVTLMGASKTVDAERIKLATDVGIQHIGENYIQEAASKLQHPSALRGLATWHMIGHLQTNKVRHALELFDVIETVHNARLAQRINTIARKLGKQVSIYLEVNMGSEISKTGVGPDQLLALTKVIASCQNLNVAGLMMVPPFTPDPEGARPYFQKLRDLRDTLNQRQILDHQVDGLSMGMSHDFEVAIEEGATVVRLGSSIWGARPA